MSHTKEKAWGVWLPETENDQAFLDFVSLSKDEAEKHARENWDRDSFQIIQVEITYHT